MDESSIAPQMREALRRLAKAVVIVTARKDDQRHAMAATAVSEVSMNPPSMLVCVNKSASLYPILSGGADFCINILHGRHRAIANACSGAMTGEARFDTGEWLDAALGVPRLADAQASFVCRNDRSLDYGSHGVFIGRVAEVSVNGAVDPLVYVDGRYTIVGAEAAA